MKKFDNTKHKDPAKINPRGKLGSDSGEIYDEDDGSTPVHEAGSADMMDEQFDTHLQDDPKSGKLGSKSSGGKPLSYDGGKPHAAASIMREVAKAEQKKVEPDQEYQGDKKVSSPKSKSQSKSYKASSHENEQARSKSQLQQKLKK